MADTTIEGPAGVSDINEALMPSITASIPIAIENMAICSGVLANCLEVAAGIISSAVINKAPTIFIATATRTAINKV